jgi:catechol 2,3-dioxygenase-like lactoylglutathione lyase family enzyme
MMIDHVSIGVRDLARAKHFYDSALKPLGYCCLSESAGSLGYGAEAPQLWIIAAEQLHFCFAASGADAVAAFHRAALAAGGHDNGAPGVRAEYGPAYYAAFVVDPDGYRLEAYCAHAAA